MGINFLEERQRGVSYPVSCQRGDKGTIYGKLVALSNVGNYREVYAFVIMS